jgi:Domain of unknown function (DUF1929)
MTYNKPYIITLSKGAQDIGIVTLMRCGSCTHAFNTDQRAIWCTFSATDDTHISFTTPPDGGVAPPGWYMVFVVKKTGQVCDYAWFAHLK